jgi:glycosyltransferase involved in cell wall biosynthesis
MSVAPVSVIIPCYCCQDTIEEAVQSVADQTLPPKEVILIDDGSTDNTPQFIQSLQNRYSPEWLKLVFLEKNYGVSHARNVGWDMASQPYIAFLDADDIWHTQKIALQYSWMSTHPKIDGSGHHYNIFFSEKDDLPQPRIYNTIPESYQLKYKKLLLSNPLTPSAVMLKKDILLRFSLGKRYCEDYLLWLQLLSEGFLLMLLGSTLVFKRIGGKNVSKKLWKMRFSDLGNYLFLWRAGKLNFIELNFFSLISLLKFISLLIIGPKAQYLSKKYLLQIIQNKK